MRRSRPSDINLKALADEFTSVLQVSFQTDVVRGLINRWLRKHYMKELERQELKFNVNFMASENTIRHLENAVFENIKGITAELRTRLQRELSLGLAAGENKNQLKKRVGDVFRGNNPTRFRFETRIRMIERTEKARAINFANHDAAKQLPFKVKKRVSVVLDGRTSPICREMNRKYGEDSQAIELKREFKVRVKVGKRTQTISDLSPPFHVNCRTQYVTVIPDEEEE